MNDMDIEGHSAIVTGGASGLGAATARALAAAEGRAEHVLTVSVAPVFAAKWLVPRLARFRDRRPDLQVRIDAWLRPQQALLGPYSMSSAPGRVRPSADQPPPWAEK